MPRLRSSSRGRRARSPAPVATRIELSVEARYPSQVWEVEVQLRSRVFDSDDDVANLIKDFHTRHTELFGFRDDGDEIDIMTWRAVARCSVAAHGAAQLVAEPVAAEPTSRRAMFFPQTGLIDGPVVRLGSMRKCERVSGPAIIESGFTTVVLPPGVVAQREHAHLAVGLAA